MPPCVGQNTFGHLTCRHGARTTLNPNLFWPDSYTFGNCSKQYPGLEISLRDETGRAEPPPIIDLVLRDGNLQINSRINISRRL